VSSHTVTLPSTTSNRKRELDAEVQQMAQVGSGSGGSSTAPGCPHPAAASQSVSVVCVGLERHRCCAMRGGFLFTLHARTHKLVQFFGFLGFWHTRLSDLCCLVSEGTEGNHFE
jgi:hypothetical protein